MLDLSVKNQVKKNLFSFLLIGIPKEVSKQLLLSYLSSIAHVVGISFLDSESVELVVMRLGDCRRILQTPLYINGCNIQPVPYLYLGKKVKHSFTIIGNTLKFEYCSRTVLVQELIDYVQSYSVSKNSYKIIGPIKLSGSQSIWSISFEFNTCSDFDLIVQSTGYSGHAYDLPISWLQFETGYQGILENSTRIFLKLLRTTDRQIQSYYDKAEALQSQFYDADDHQDDDDSFLFPGSIESVNKTEKLEFFSDFSNRIFFEKTSQLYSTSSDLSLSPKHTPTAAPTSSKNVIKNTAVEIYQEDRKGSKTSLASEEGYPDVDHDNLLLQFIERKISFEMLITLQAEQKKSKFQSLRSRSGKKSKVSTSSSSEEGKEGKELSDSELAFLEDEKFRKMTIIRKELLKELENESLGKKESDALRKRVKRLKKALQRKKYKIHTRQTKKIKGQAGSYLLSYTSLQQHKK